VYLPTYAVKAVIVSTIWYRKLWKPKIYKKAHYFSLYHHLQHPAPNLKLQPLNVGVSLVCWVVFFLIVYIYCYISSDEKGNINSSMENRTGYQVTN
jgi:hypothetical protein